MMDDVNRLIEQHNDRERRQTADAFGHWMGVDCRIHPGDEIFRFIHDHPTSTNPVRDYLADGWRTMVELMVPMERLGSPLVNTQAFLEFACGYGRFTRHLVRFIEPDRIHAADVMPDSARFVSETFGVHGFESHSDPARLSWPGTYDVVFVLSLFSHLPEATWKPWLSRLFEAVAPGGLLIFTTHGSGFARRHGVDLGASGFFFHAGSESDHLDGQEYGTTITATDYVREAVLDLPGAELALHLPDHFWSGQDAWFVRRQIPVSAPVRWLRRFTRGG